jgi:uncharacterized protein YceH (UPF0502 family)
MVMELTAAEGRVLGCLLARQDDRSGSPALSLDELRFMCNQSHRPDAAAFDDRTVDDALVALKSKGLVRFVFAGRNVGPVRYRHRADERWRLGEGELAVLAALLLDGPQTADEVQARLADGLARGDFAEAGEVTIDVAAALDALAGRTPAPFATRVPPPAWGGDTLWAEVLTGQPSPEELYQIYERRRSTAPSGPAPGSAAGPAPAAAGSAAGPAAGSRPASAQSQLPSFAEPPRRSVERHGSSERQATGERQASLSDVLDRLTRIERQLAGIEAQLVALRSGRPSRPAGQESSRMIR